MFLIRSLIAIVLLAGVTLNAHAAMGDTCSQPVQLTQEVSTPELDAAITVSLQTSNTTIPALSLTKVNIKLIVVDCTVSGELMETTTVWDPAWSTTKVGEALLQDESFHDYSSMHQYLVRMNRAVAQFDPATIAWLTNRVLCSIKLNSVFATRKYSDRAIERCVLELMGVENHTAGIVNFEVAIDPHTNPKERFQEVLSDNIKLLEVVPLGFTINK